MSANARRFALLSMGVIGAFLGFMTFEARAAIVIGKGIAGVNVGDSPARVKAKFGKPTLARSGNSKFGPSWLYLDGPIFVGQISFDVKGRGVKVMTTSSPREKTSKGVGPQVSYARTRKAYPNAKCRVDRNTPTAWCTLRTHSRGKTIETTFLFLMREMDSVQIRRIS